MKYLHAMVRVTDVNVSLRFYCDALGLELIGRRDSQQGRFTNYYLSPPGDREVQIELTHNWDSEHYVSGRNFGHLAFGVKDIYAVCDRLQSFGVVINRPPRDGYMAFVRSPDQISIELLQEGEPLSPRKPWMDMPNVGTW